jgi:hypoxanthine-guanine phosphoribosyltransferase
MDIDTEKTIIEGRQVVLLDDMLDRGITAAFTADHLIERHGAVGVDLAVLTKKQTERDPRFDLFAGQVTSCFDVPDVWVVGMGMDDARVAHEANRWLPYLAVASET